MNEEIIEAEFFNVYVAETSRGIAPALILKYEEEYLPIYIGLSEAISTSSGNSEKEPFRPFAHDLILNFLNEIDVKVVNILIDELKEGIYFAQLILDKNGEEIKIDARPSDSIALAVRVDANIFIKKSILEEASKTKNEIEEKMKSLDNYLK